MDAARATASPEGPPREPGAGTGPSPEGRVILVMGVAGSGKTTVGLRLAASLGWAFHDADDDHPPSNHEKMRAGVPLTDQDRAPWLASIRRVITECLARRERCVVACSALKRAYRDILRVDARVQIVYLKGDPTLFAERLRTRPGHFFPPHLLTSQFVDLEEPSADSVIVDAAASPEELVRTIRRHLAIE